MAANILDGILAAEVNVGGFPSHGKKHFEFIAISGNNIQLDAGTMRREPPHDPAAAHLDEGIWTPHRPADDRLIHEFARTIRALRPMNRRWHQGFGFPGDPSAM